MKAIDEQFVSSDKVLASTLMKRLLSMTLDRSRTVRENIMEKRDIAAKLKSLEVDMSEPFLVHFILNSLPAEYGPFKISYNTHKDKWSINELLTMCVQEEERLKHEIPESVIMVTHGKRNAKKGKSVPMKKKSTFDKDACRFFSDNTWWIDSGATIHIAKIMQGFLTQRKPIGSEQYVYSGNRAHSRVEGVGFYRLILKDDFHLDLENTFYVPEYSRNLIYLSRLSISGYDLYFHYPSVKLLKDIKVIGFGNLNGNLYKLELYPTFECNVLNLHDKEIGTKRCIINENSSGLWHKRLGHISIDRVKRYMYLYFLFNKSEALDAFKDYKTEVEKQAGAQIKIVRFDRGGEYYGRYTDKGQVKSPFAEFLESEGIIAQYTMPGTPQQNGVAKRRNRTLMDMGSSTIGSKWIFKTKRDSYGNIDRYKARLVAKGFTQREGIDYHETFSLVSKKDSLRIIMALVAHFDLELHQMDVKITFLNGDLEEEVYMHQPEGFCDKVKSHLVCKLNKSIYGLKQASRQWYIKFHNVVSSFEFTKNIIDQCIYLKISGSKYIFRVLYVDDILLASSDLGLLHETKQFLIQNFEMKDMGEASFVIGIEIHRDRSQRLLGLSQKTYIERILERFGMKNCSPIAAPIIKGDTFSLNQCPQNALEKGQIKDIVYASLVGILVIST
ncbi:uncharacterized protein LOC142182230 [Nicotiana tabacum]|uniref:Uncharacterized protein LOC142182230 n=1 Tax=Nicotiana tabacum TaxID=4097 RepID=A0AC58USH1_TOBAC